MPELPRSEITSLLPQDISTVPVTEGRSITSLTENNSENSQVENERRYIPRFITSLKGTFPRVFNREASPREAALIEQVVEDVVEAAHAMGELDESAGVKRRDFLKMLGGVMGSLAASGGVFGALVANTRSTPIPEGAPSNVVSFVAGTEGKGATNNTNSNNNSSNRNPGQPSNGESAGAQDGDVVVRAEDKDQLETQRSGVVNEVIRPEVVFKKGPLRFDLFDAQMTMYMPRSMTGRSDKDVVAPMNSMPILGRSETDGLPEEVWDAFANPAEKKNQATVITAMTEKNFDRYASSDQRPVVVIGHAGYGGGAEFPFNQLSALVEGLRDQNEARGKYIVLHQKVDGKSAYVVMQLVKNNVAGGKGFGMELNNGVSKEHLFFNTASAGLEDDDSADVIFVTCRGRANGWIDKAMVITRIDQVITGEDLVKADRFNSKGLESEYASAGKMLINKSLNPVYGTDLAGSQSAMKYLRETTPGGNGISAGLMENLLMVERELFGAKESDLSLRKKIATTPVYYGNGVTRVLNSGRGGSSWTTLLEVDAVGELHCNGLGRNTRSEVTDAIVTEEYLQMKQYGAILESLGSYLKDVAKYDSPEKVNHQFLRGGLRFMCEVVQRGVLKEEFGIENNFYEMEILGERYGTADIDGAVTRLLTLAEEVTGREYSSKDLLNPDYIKEINEAFRGKYVGKLRGVNDEEVQFWNCFGMKRPGGTLNERPLIESLPEEA